MSLSRARSVTASVGVVLVGVTLSACSAFSSAASCEDFQAEFKKFANPKIVEMVNDAYFSKFSDEKVVSGATAARNLSLVRTGCQRDPDGKIDRFVER